MKKDRKPGPRSGGATRDYGKPRGPRPPRLGSASGAARPPSRFRAEDRPPRPERLRSEERGEGAIRDPYQRAQRPSRPREEGGRGFTVTLDPDVARVFRGDASVNKALRLVLQLMQVVQGPSTQFRTGPRPAFGERPRPPGYQGSAEARGFTRKPRFDADTAEGGDIEE